MGTIKILFIAALIVVLSNLGSSSSIRRTRAPSMSEGKREEGDILLFHKEIKIDKRDSCIVTEKVKFPEDENEAEGRITMFKLTNHNDYFGVLIHTGGVDQQCLGLTLTSEKGKGLYYHFDVYGFNKDHSYQDRVFKSYT